MYKILKNIDVNNYGLQSMVAESGGGGGGTDTSDATAVANNIKSGETAYARGEKLTGTLPVLTYPTNPVNPQDWDYQFQEATSSTLKRVTRDGTNYILGTHTVVDNVTEEWMFSGNSKMKMGFPENKIATAVNLTANKLKKGTTILGVTGTYEGTSVPDWTQLGYSSAPQMLLDEFEYSKQIKNNFGPYSRFTNSEIVIMPLVNISTRTDLSEFCKNCTRLSIIAPLNTNSATTMNQMFTNCSSINTIPLLNTSNVTNISQMFNSCRQLKEIPLLDTGKVTNMSMMFYYCDKLETVPALDTSSVTGTGFNNTFGLCSSLSNASLNNILQMCINAVNVTSNKTLKYIGLTSAQATTCQSLSNWNDFVNAGWSTGY